MKQQFGEKGCETISGGGFLALASEWRCQLDERRGWLSNYFIKDKKKNHQIIFQIISSKIKKGVKLSLVEIS